MWQSHSPSIQSVPSGSKLSVIIPGDQTHAPARIGYKDKGVRSWRHKDKALAKRVAAPGEQVVRVPQSLYISPNNSDIRDKKPDILFNIPREGGIKLDAALNLGFDYPREWKTEYVKCFATTKRITIRINVGHFVLCPLKKAHESVVAGLYSLWSHDQRMR
ncbi:hypothetical protein BDY19DRAFT_903813 [Irpex rosettiformis]|uniref:Uncharacterized protein n=1 Tax=Irpex rosettiformis TaxID=378272 RepID=A0ACB8UCW3_9APHY|nr:hypothetical protein BDY19DRAFT_903813 [Irpex rosettiformis]